MILRIVNPIGKPLSVALVLFLEMGYGRHIKTIKVREGDLYTPYPYLENFQIYYDEEDDNKVTSIDYWEEHESWQDYVRERDDLELAY